MAHSLTSEQAANPPLFYQADEYDHAAGGSTMLGFWIYLMSDCLIFAVLFATYGVLGSNYAAGPRPTRSVRPAAGRGQHVDAAVVLHHLWLRHARGATASRSAPRSVWLAITALFGAAFLGIELYEFAHMIHEGAARSAAPSCPRSSRSWARTACMSRSASSGSLH